MKETLVILAAGMGSRYGGLKQIDGVGNHNEPIIEFTIFDAIKAGFKKVVLIIKKEHQEAFEEAIKDLNEQGMEKMIVDLRDNPGGNLSTVCEMLDLILPEGTIVYTEDKNNVREVITSDDKKQMQIPMAVLINGNSASASEIFAGAVQDFKVGTIVGTQSYGTKSLYNNYPTAVMVVYQEPNSKTI